MKTPLHNGDVVLVEFPFTDMRGSKYRPAVIVSTATVHKGSEDFTLLFISSEIPEDLESYEIAFPATHPDFKLSGLKKNSVFKAHKLATIQRDLVRRKLGLLGKKIRVELETALRSAVSLAE